MDAPGRLVPHIERNTLELARGHDQCHGPGQGDAAIPVARGLELLRFVGVEAVFMVDQRGEAHRRCKQRMRHRRVQSAPVVGQDQIETLHCARKRLQAADPEAALQRRKTEGEMHR